MRTLIEELLSEIEAPNPCIREPHAKVVVIRNYGYRKITPPCTINNDVDRVAFIIASKLKDRKLKKVEIVGFAKGTASKARLNQKYAAPRAKKMEFLLRKEIDKYLNQFVKVRKLKPQQKARLLSSLTNKKLLRVRVCSKRVHSSSQSASKDRKVEIRVFS